MTQFYSETKMRVINVEIDYVHHPFESYSGLNRS